MKKLKAESSLILAILCQILFIPLVSFLVHSSNLDPSVFIYPTRDFLCLSHYTTLDLCCLSRQRVR